MATCSALAWRQASSLRDDTLSRYGLKSDIPTHEEVRTPSFEVDRLVSVLEMKEKTERKNNVKD